MIGVVVVLVISALLAYTDTRSRYLAVKDKPEFPKQTTKYTLQLALFLQFMKTFIKCLLIAAFFHILTVLVMYGIKHF